MWCVKKLKFLFFWVLKKFKKVFKKNESPSKLENDYKHGDDKNTQIGGTCADFLSLNGLSSCCNSKDDECYMIHYDTRCYCDVFCNRQSGDCCPDALNVCAGQDLIPSSKTDIIRSTVTMKAYDVSNSREHEIDGLNRVIEESDGF